MTHSDKLIDNKDEGRLEMPVDGKVAFIEYIPGSKRMILTHTEVPESLEGQGVGGQLVKAALEYAREQDLMVVPQCQFVASYIGRHPEYADVVEPENRSALE
jgi:uncharacterized protein